MKLLTQKFRVKNRGGMISLKTGKMLLRKGELGAQGQEQMTLVLGGNPYQRPERNTKSLEPSSL